MSAVFLWRWPFVQETGLVDHLHTRNNNETMREWLGGGICKMTLNIDNIDIDHDIDIDIDMIRHVMGLVEI